MTNSGATHNAPGTRAADETKGEDSEEPAQATTGQPKADKRNESESEEPKNMMKSDDGRNRRQREAKQHARNGRLHKLAETTGFIPMPATVCRLGAAAEA